jgi:UbiD family decarboxylase
MSYKDLRLYINQLEQVGQLQRIKAEVDWDTEIGAILRQVFKRKKGRLACSKMSRTVKYLFFQGPCSEQKNMR